MSSIRRIAICLVRRPGSVVIGLLMMVLASVGLLLASVSPASAEPGGVPFTVELTGAAEVPGPGDSDGSGTARLTINPGLGVVCSTIEVAGIAAITAAHIHVGSPVVAGPVVVHLSTDGCTEGVDRELALDIILNPSAYYVNVHNDPFGAGAVRGQLDR